MSAYVAILAGSLFSFKSSSHIIATVTPQDTYCLHFIDEKHWMFKEVNQLAQSHSVYWSQNPAISTIPWCLPRSIDLILENLLTAEV